MNLAMHNFDRDRKYFFLAVNTGFTENRLPDARCLDFYRIRSGHGLHCSIVGNVVIPNGTGTNDVSSGISADRAWHSLADVISEQGAIAGIQLASTWNGYKGMVSFVPPKDADPVSTYLKIASEISEEEIRNVFAELTRGTELAIDAGFRHIQLHAAHGYLFNLLLDSHFSPYAELALQLTSKWAEEIAASQSESSIRFSMWSGDPVFDQSRQKQIADDLILINVNYLDVSAGFYNVDKKLIYPSTADLLSERVDATMSIASENARTNFILSGKSSRAWDTSLPKNIHIGICRDLIANPNFLRDRDNGCKNCMKCHYFSRGQDSLTCGQWETSEVAAI
jgi:2,4-dienoyl-CoA reductase-like NADH-dependent reductase (Old Yellow Enzyme family)